MNTGNHQITLDLIHLVRCALEDEAPSQERVAQMDLNALFQLAQAHSMSAIVWAGLGPWQAVCPPELAAAWKERAQRATRKALLLDIGREEILNALEEAGIWYLPLKGSLLQDLYPAPGMREMSDNDILFDQTRRTDVTRILEGLGYETELGNLDNHDIYTKPPVYNYEMHLTILGEHAGPVKRDYYRNFEEKLLPGDTGPCSRRMRREDFYIHLIAHAHGHYYKEGIGLRMFADLFVYRSALAREMDWDYIAAELSKLQVAAFHSHLCQVTRRLFLEPEQLSDTDWEMVDFCESSGTHGTYATRARNALRRLQGEDGMNWKTRLKYIWTRLCPDRHTCQLYFPFYAKYPFLKPVLVITRLVRALLFRRDLLKSEFQSMTDPKQ